MFPLFKVRTKGAYGSIQDLGRFGFQRFGVPVSGPMDRRAFQLGQYILGNEKNTPALELFLGGQSFEVLSDHRIVITGADLGALIDEEPAPIWKSFFIFKGQTLRFARPLSGSIAYLIPEGGFAAELMLGSASVYPKGKLGAPLVKEMILYASDKKNDKLQTQRGLIAGEVPTYAEKVTVAVWPSPHLELFEKVSLDTFFESSYRLKAGDRMGYLLEGPALEFVHGSDILSEATQFGVIQVPNSGKPIVLMADAQTTGGYATIGKVASEDLWKVAQLKNGGEIRFKLM